MLFISFCYYVLVYTCHVCTSSHLINTVLEPLFIQRNVSLYINKVLNTTYAYFTDKSANTSSHLSPQCLQILHDVIYNKYINNIVIFKLIQNTPLIKNDVTNYKPCYYNYYHFTSPTEVAYIKHNITYILFIFNDHNKQEPLEHDVVKRTFFGICVPKGCLNSDYVTLLETTAQIINFNYSRSYKVINAYPVQKSISTYSEYFSAYYIPFYILLSFALISMFPYKQYFPQFMRVIFDFSENCEEISKNNVSLYDSVLYNDSGLNIVNGLHGIGVVCFMLGTIFEVIFLSPVTTNKRLLTDVFMNPFFSVLIFAQRFGKRLCYCISGLTLTYKMLNYLDNELEKVEPKDENECEYELSGVNNEIKFQYKQINANAFNESYSKHHRMLTFRKTYCLFILRYVYKVVLFILFMLFYLFSFYKVIRMLCGDGPFWVYFNNAILKTFHWKNIFNNIIKYLFYANENYNYMLNWSTTNIKANPFQTFINEMYFFMLYSLVIFYCFKRNRHLDYFIITFHVFVIVFKVLIFTLFFDDKYKSFAPAKSFMFVNHNNNNDFMLRIPFYNLTHFNLGVFIGLVNYSVQKSNFTRSDKKFLDVIVRVIGHFRKQRTLGQSCVLLGCAVFIFVEVFSYCLFFRRFNYKRALGIERVFENYYVNLFYLVDIEVCIGCLFYIVLYYFFYNSDAIVLTVLRNPYWRFIARPYCVVLLCCHMISYFILYQGDNKVSIDERVIVFYLGMGCWFVAVLSGILFVLLEVPCKKMSKMIIKGRKGNRLR